MRKVAIFDLDGTLADMTHRLGSIDRTVHKNSPDWDEFFKQCVNDSPRKDVIKINQILKNHFYIHIITGRSERVRSETEEWLVKYNVHFDKLTMRGKDTRRPDYVLKKNWLDEFYPDTSDVFCVFEDRSRVVKMWRDAGIPCYQVKEGDY